MDNAQLMLMKREVIQTTNSTGWRYILKLADNTVKNMERKAIDEEDDVKGSNLRRQAKAARQFLNEFTQSVEAFKQVEVAEPEEDTKEVEEFYQVALD